MKSHVALALVVAALLAAPLNAAADPSGYFRREHTIGAGSYQCAGTAAAGYCILRKEAAIALCNSDPNCSGFGHATGAPGWLRQFPDSYQLFTGPIERGNGEWTSFVKAPRQPAFAPAPVYAPAPVFAPPSGEREWVSVSGDCGGNDISVTTGVDVAGCQAQCSATPGCVGFSYRPGDRRCVPKRATCFNPDPHSDHIFYTTRSLLAANGDCGGNDITVLTGLDVRGCSERCRQTPGCMGFSYRQSDGRCVPKSTGCVQPDPGGDHRFFLLAGQSVAFAPPPSAPPPEEGWKCFPGVQTPLRYSRGDIECAARNGRDCLWGSCPGTNPEKQPWQAPPGLIPLTCTVDNSYGNPDSWCSKGCAQTHSCGNIWKCVPGVATPLRVVGGDVQCAALNGHDCLWGSCPGNNERPIPWQPPPNLVPLPCAVDNSYGNPDSWCRKGCDAFRCGR